MIASPASGPVDQRGILDLWVFISGKVRMSENQLCKKSRWPSWAFRPNEPYGFRGRKAILNHAHALVSACP